MSAPDTNRPVTECRWFAVLQYNHFLRRFQEKKYIPLSGSGLRQSPSADARIAGSDAPIVLAFKGPRDLKRIVRARKLYKNTGRVRGACAFVELGIRGHKSYDVDTALEAVADILCKLLWARFGHVIVMCPCRGHVLKCAFPVTVFNRSLTLTTSLFFLMLMLHT